jgi:uncharacterized cupin superfamily protein
LILIIGGKNIAFFVTLKKLNNKDIMSTIFHKEDLQFVMRESPIPEYRWHTTPWLGKTVNSRQLNFDIRSLDPGKFSFPYHYHRASEEFFMIISGEATLRSPDGFHKLKEGDMVFFEEGSSSAHQLYNHSEAACIYLDIRAASGVDVINYPDTGKIALSPFMEIFNGCVKADYYQGEEEVAKKWPEEIIRRS